MAQNEEQSLCVASLKWGMLGLIEVIKFLLFLPSQKTFL